MDPAFLNAGQARLTEHVVLGLPLYPLTIGHLFLLSELDITFLVDVNVEPKFEDMLALVFIAGHARASDARRSLSLMRWPLTKCLFLLWGMLARRKNMVLESMKLHRYLKSQGQAPRLEPPSGETVALNSPEHWRLAVMLMVDFHLSLSEAMDTGLNFARNLWAVQGERTEKLKLSWSPATTFAIERLKTMTAGEVN